MIQDLENKDLEKVSGGYYVPDKEETYTYKFYYQKEIFGKVFIASVTVPYENNNLAKAKEDGITAAKQWCQDNKRFYVGPAVSC